MTFLNWATLGTVCALGIVAIVVAAVLFIAWGPADGTLQSDDPTPFEDEPDAGLRILNNSDAVLVVDPPVVPVYIPPVSDRDAMTMFFGGLVHKRCIGPYLRDDVPPCAGCAVHLDHVLTGA